jgi:hypothetical protein
MVMTVAPFHGRHCAVVTRSLQSVEKFSLFDAEEQSRVDGRKQRQFDPRAQQQQAMMPIVILRHTLNRPDPIRKVFQDAVLAKSHWIGAELMHGLLEQVSAYSLA